MTTFKSLPHGGVECPFCGRRFSPNGIAAHTTRSHRVRDIEEAHTEAILEASDREQTQELEGDHAKALEENDRRETQARRWAAVDAAYSDPAEDDRELEGLTAREASLFEIEGRLPERLSSEQKAAVRRAFERRAACPWTNVLGQGVTGPCQRWAGHPGGCVVEPLTYQGARVFAERGVFYRDGGVAGARAAVDAQRREAEAAEAEELSITPCEPGPHPGPVPAPDPAYYQPCGCLINSANAHRRGCPGEPPAGGTRENPHGSYPAGGYPSPFAVALLVAMATTTPRVSPLGVLGDVRVVLEELEGLGYAVKIPGIEVRMLTEAGRAFVRDHILSAPVGS